MVRRKLPLDFGGNLDHFTLMFSIRAETYPATNQALVFHSRNFAVSVALAAVSSFLRAIVVDTAYVVVSENGKFFYLVV